MTDEEGIGELDGDGGVEEGGDGVGMLGGDGSAEGEVDSKALLLGCIVDATVAVGNIVADAVGEIETAESGVCMEGGAFMGDAEGTSIDAPGEAAEDGEGGRVGIVLVSGGEVGSVEGALLSGIDDGDCF